MVDVDFLRYNANEQTLGSCDFRAIIITNYMTEAPIECGELGRGRCLWLYHGNWLSLFVMLKLIVFNGKI